MASPSWRWFVALGLLSACGGRVVMDTSDGAGGDGGGGVAALSACTKLCEARTANCPYKGSCIDHCLERASYLGLCGPENEALTLCVAAEPWLAPDCKSPKVLCDAEVVALQACVYPAGPCETGKCVAGAGPGGSMKCDIVCGDVVYTSACGGGGKATGFPMDCVCQIDGEPVGTCQNVTGDGSIGMGCCSKYFAESE